MDGLRSALDPLWRAVRMGFDRGRLIAVSAEGKMQRLKISLRAGEMKENIEHFEPYGFTSHPLAGSDVVVGFVGADRSHGIALVVGDRRYRLRNLKGGEVAIHDDQGQSVHLTREGIVIKGAGLPMLITDTPKVRMETPLVEVTGDIIDHCDTQPHTVAQMRGIYNTHTHPVRNVQGGGSTVDTSQPSQTE
jgi:phage baseplate assembly protein V